MSSPLNTWLPAFAPVVLILLGAGLILTRRKLVRFQIALLIEYFRWIKDPPPVLARLLSTVAVIFSLVLIVMGAAMVYTRVQDLV